MTRVIAALAAALLCAAGASAQELTVDELVALALARSPAILAARADADVARGQIVQAGVRSNPSVSASHQEMFDGPDHQTMVDVQWPLDLFRRPARVASAEREVEVIASSIADRERVLAAEVRRQAGEVLGARRTLAVLADLLRVNREMRDLLAARVREGALPQLDLDIVQVEVQSVEAQEALQGGLVEAAIIALKALVGLPPESTVTLGGNLEASVREAGVLPAAGENPAGRENRADVRAAAARVTLAAARLEQARQEGRWDAGLFAEYSYERAGFPQRAFGEGGALVPIEGLFHNVKVGVMITLPFGNRNQGSILAASAAHSRVQHEATATVLTASAEVATAESRDRAAGRAAALYSGAAAQARRNLDVVRETYTLGRASLLDVLAEQRRYLEVERAYTTTLSDAFEARVALFGALGEVR